MFLLLLKRALIYLKLWRNKVLTMTDFNFISEYPLDKVVYYKAGSTVVPSGSYGLILDIPYTKVADMCPTVAYTYDGTNWYKDGATAMQWSPGNYQHIPILSCQASCNNTTVRLMFQSGPFGDKTVNYKIYGIALNV